ncbi:unnamed protein product [Darwinula stevensoni]|uniref:Uncharacterized protein n=1 Tax=Darwinula stevensoni TaxID=69355 RepID=A0A7R8X065_9CRUS|nr:unnamed protein product [Darwinula stevensoni]CAG0880875.1 unnamed protein product [Darwinula stevensoni]
MEWRTWLWVLVVMCSCDVWLRVAVGFNLDIENSRIYKGKSNTMFGFSVAQHVSRGESWLLVGAPRAQTKQPGVIRGGAVYKCEASRQGYTCQDEIPFDRADQKTLFESPGGHHGHYIRRRIAIRNTMQFELQVLSLGGLPGKRGTESRVKCDLPALSLPGRRGCTKTETRADGEIPRIRRASSEPLVLRGPPLRA